jgi:alkanesulfonate monooxygenase SsuD/methylene tetrahydromethanopterin reductase-like flavin-dependent oxidoreductase (luciferase family)
VEAPRHRVREYIEAMRALWACDVVSYHGEFKEAGDKLRVTVISPGFVKTNLADS